MATPKHPSTFWGPQFNYMRLEDWPWDLEIHLQLHDMQEGEFWNDADGIILQSPHILLPLGFEGNFLTVDMPFFYQYRHRPELFRIAITSFDQLNFVFSFTIVHGPNQFAYNELTDPAGVFAFGGFATLSAKRT